MDWLRRLVGRSEEAAPEASAEPAGREETDLTFRDLARRLESPTPAVRREAVPLVSALLPAEAERSLVRSYVRYGDRWLLDAVAAYGPRLTKVVARAALDNSLAPSHRARLMELLAATGDPNALRVLREALADFDPAVRVAAAAGLVGLGAEEGLHTLEAELMSPDAARRTLALTALRDRDGDEASRALAAEQVRAYLLAGTAVPEWVGVSMPMLIDPRGDLVDHLLGVARGSDRRLTLLSGPATGSLADEHRGAFVAGLADLALYFSTERHALPEQLAILRAACAAAREGSRHVALVGPVPAPSDAWPMTDLFPADPGDPYAFLLVYAGPHKVREAQEWWEWLEDRYARRSDMEVVLTDLVLGAPRLGDEELVLHDLESELALGRDGASFARAYLARLGS